VEWEERREEGERGRGSSFFFFFFFLALSSFIFTFNPLFLLLVSFAAPFATPAFSLSLRRSVYAPMAVGAPAIKAAVQFAKAGTAAKKASVVKEIFIGLSLGMVCGVAFKVCLF